MRRASLMAGLLAISWLLWSGIYTPALLAFGTVSCLLALWLAWRTDFFDPSTFSLHVLPRLPRYWASLLVDIVRANVSVARIVFQPRMPISPVMVTLDASRLPPVGQAILANSLTLTPASVALDVDQGRIRVHCLTQDAARELTEGEPLSRAARLTRR